MSDSTKTLIIHPNLRNIEYSEATNLLDLLNSRDVFIEQSCSGSGTCTTCRVFVLAGHDALGRTAFALSRRRHGFESLDGSMRFFLSA